MSFLKVHEPTRGLFLPVGATYSCAMPSIIARASATAEAVASVSCRASAPLSFRAARGLASAL